MAYGLYFLGEIALMQGDLALARRRHQEALDMRTALGEKGTAAESRAALAGLALAEGQPAAAEAHGAGSHRGLRGSDGERQRGHGPRRAGPGAGGDRDASRPPLREASRARALVKDSQNAMARLPVAVAAAQVEAASAPRDAVRALEAARREAEQLGIPRAAFEARRALADVERRTSPGSSAATLASLRKDAAARGFNLFAR